MFAHASQRESKWKKPICTGLDDPQPTEREPSSARTDMERARPRAQQRSITPAAGESVRTSAFEFVNHYWSNVAAPGDGRSYTVLT